MLSNLLRASGAVVLASLVPTLYAQAKTFDKAYQVPGRASLQLNADDASIHASSCGNCSAVHIHVDYHDADPSRYKLEETQSGGSVRFELKLKPMSGWHMGWSRGPEIAVELPASTDARLNTASGSVSLQGVRGDEDLRSSSGSVTATEIEGALKVESGSGTLHLRALRGSLNAHTGSGSIDADGVIGLRRLSTGSGSIHLTLQRGSMLDGGATVETGSGSIEIRMDPATHAELRASTGSGGIHSDLPVTVQGDQNSHALHGTLNGGGPTLRIGTGSGSISLHSL